MVSRATTYGGVELVVRPPGSAIGTHHRILWVWPHQAVRHHAPECPCEAVREAVWALSGEGAPPQTAPGKGLAP